jgi:hypothetical protein
MDVAERAIAACEDLAAHDVQRRNIGPLAAHVRGSLLPAARSIVAHPAPSIAIITGFFLIHGEPPNCETDGPPGAALLAAGLAAAGVPCRIATDVFSADVVQAAVSGARLDGIVPIDAVSAEAGDRGVPLDLIRRRWESGPAPISHVVSIERCGPSADGRPRDARGVDISARNLTLEGLYRGGWVTIGIGDLGNELGMGSLPRKLVADNIRNGEALWCTVPSDYPLVSGISNWGAAALLAAIGILDPRIGRPSLPFLEPSFAERLLDAVYRAGAVASDSSGGPPAPRRYVDGLPWSHLEGTHREIWLACHRALGLGLGQSA